MNEHDDDSRLAATIATAAGRLLLELRASGVVTGRALGDAGDRAANALIVAALRQHRPDDGLLSEESADNAERLAKRRVWIVDPLDGTREYSEGRDDWAVHVGLSIDGEAAVGAVALPARGLVFASHDVAVPPAQSGAPRMVVSRTRPPAEAVFCASALGADMLPLGSAGAKAMAVVEGVADIYLHAGGQWEWDNCAPAAVALAAGLHASRIDGSPLVYNRADPRLPDLLICRPEWSERALTALGHRSRSRNAAVSAAS